MQNYCNISNQVLEQQLTKYESKVKIQTQKQYLDYLIDPSFQGEKRIFGVSFEDNQYPQNIFFRKCRLL